MSAKQSECITQNRWKIYDITQLVVHTKYIREKAGMCEAVNNFLDRRWKRGKRRKAVGDMP